MVVSNGSKILIWKQITTKIKTLICKNSCFQWFKDTNLKANHNQIKKYNLKVWVVSNGSKILIWKQITTLYRVGFWPVGCFQWFKDTNLKANHNPLTGSGSQAMSCFQWFKDTNLKANHNCITDVSALILVVSNGSKILIWKQITT